MSPTEEPAVGGVATRPDGRAWTPHALGWRYGIGSFGTSMFGVAPGLLLLYFLTDTLGVAAGLAGLALFIPKIFDLLLDPMIGGWSDRLKHPWGRRRPFLLAGAVLLPTAFVIMFSVPDFGTPTGAFIWVTLAFLLGSVGFALYQVPYTAMAAELSPDSQVRTVAVGWRMAAVMIGTLTAGALAATLRDAFGGGRHGYALMAVMLAVLMAPALFATFALTRHAPRIEAAPEPAGLGAMLAAVGGNRPFLVLVGAYVVQLFALTCFLAAIPYYAAAIIGGPPEEAGATQTAMFATAMVPAMLAMPLWVWLARRIGKKTGFVLSLLLAGGAIVLLAVPGIAGERPAVLAALGMFGIAYGGTQLYPLSMLADVVAYDRARTGGERQGLFSGFVCAAEKGGNAIGPFLAAQVLALAGYREAEGGRIVSQSAAALEGILIATAWLPGALLLASVPILLMYKIPKIGG